MSLPPHPSVTGGDSCTTGPSGCRGLGKLYLASATSRARHKEDRANVLQTQPTTPSICNSEKLHGEASFATPKSIVGDKIIVEHLTTVNELPEETTTPLVA